MQGVSRGLRRFDVFPKFDSKFEQDARDKTIGGAFFSIAAVLFITVLFIGELKYFFSVESRHELYVDTDVSGEMRIGINVSFLAIPCDLISVDVVDGFGEFQQNLDKTTTKLRLDSNGEPIALADELVKPGHKDAALNAEDAKAHGTESGARAVESAGDVQGAADKHCLSCYGAEQHPGACCNTCEDVRMAYESRGWSFHVNDVSFVQCAAERLMQQTRQQRHEGCRIMSTMKVKRVQGNLHFIPGHAFVHMGQHLHDLMGQDVNKMNLSHIVHELQFGDGYPGLMNPLTNAVRRLGNDQPESASGKCQYFIKVVPTRFEKLGGAEVLETNQYSVTENFAAHKIEEGFVPGVFFLYDLSPIKVHIYEARPYQSLAHFLLQLCAIGGGVFTVMGLIDAMMYHSVIKIRRKLQIGKQS